ncbi:MAG: Flp pilus assembly complex ATPase component TadA [Candidatus Doudnabacteria bacterium]|nr:Flp pilus assembly complex ATPase component TadA [Candidatus Doudnabacteria bacterium]
MAQSVKTISPLENFEQFLVKNGFLSAETLAELQIAQRQNGQGIPEMLLSKKILEEEELTKAKAAFFNIPYIDLRKVAVPPEVVSFIPKESNDFYSIAPFELKDKVLKVAITDPGNLAALEALEFLGQKQNLQIQLFLASGPSVDSVIGRKKNLKRVVGQALEDIQKKEADTQRIQTSATKEKEAKPEVIEEAPIIKIVDVILSNAVEANASDIHIEPSDKDVRVRYRVDGILHTSLMLPSAVHAAIVTRIKILTNLKIDESRLPQDGRFHMDVGKKSVDLRVSILPLIYGEKIVMRILDKSTSAPTLEDLGFRATALTWVKDNIKKTHGIFLITGPTGSGKSTTLYAILSMLNTTSVNIVTLEDPVEYFISGVNQSQVNPEIGLTFATGLRSILRQDPNVVMVGEIRDKETAELAVHAALTGHLVFSTLHTNNSIGAMPRLIDMGIEPFLLSASVNVVAAQRLVRKICPNCKQEVPLTVVFEQEIRKELVGIPAAYLENMDKNKFKIFKGAGCEKCGRSGYQGRMGIYEVLPVVTEVQDLVLNKAPAHKIYEFANKMGMITMKQDGIVKALKGETTMEEIIRVTTE